MCMFADERKDWWHADAERRLKKEMTILNLSVLQHWINTGRIDASKPISFKELLSTRCVHGIKDGVKLLAGV